MRNTFLYSPLLQACVIWVQPFFWIGIITAVIFESVFIMGLVMILVSLVLIAVERMRIRKIPITKLGIRDWLGLISLLYCFAFGSFFAVLELLDWAFCG
jgi:hypothetical protein